MTKSTIISTNCDTNVNFNQGCGIQTSPAAVSYGPAFNANGGGWYAMERTTEFVKVWFWPRYGSPEPPLDVRFNLGGVDTTLWGKPASFFPSSDTCDLESKLAAHNIIINLTLCKSFCCRCLVLSHLNMFLIGGDFA